MDTLLPNPGASPIFHIIYIELSENQQKRERKLCYINIWYANSFLNKVIKKGMTYNQLISAWHQEFSTSISTPDYLKNLIATKKIARKILKKKENSNTNWSHFVANFVFLAGRILFN